MIQDSASESDVDDQGELVFPIVKFFDKNNSTNRVISDLEWSPKIPDLLLASYS